MDWGTKIREARIKKNLSQAQLAKILGTTQPLIAAYETDRRIPKLETLERIAVALDMSIFSVSPSSITDGAIIPTQEERALLAAVSDLNDTGIKKVCEFAEDISTNPKYRK